MNNTPIVSISIPTYNRSLILDNTLKSLFNQIDSYNLFEEVEVVISDNASNDNTYEVIDKYIKTNKYKIVYNKNSENLGVIKNILKLIDLCSGKYWMFYGDDDLVPEGSLPQLVKCFNANNTFPAFMFKQYDYISSSFKEYTTPQLLSISSLAKNYFYYIGNAGVFAVDTLLAKKALTINYDNLIKTCWPQTEVFFIAAHLSESVNQVYASTIPAVHSYIGNLNYNSSYYFFETTLYSLLRSALSINKIVKTNFAEHAFHSIYGVEFFDTFKVVIIEHYIFYDFDNEKEEFRKSLADAMLNVPLPYKNEITTINNWINKPKWFLKIWLYLNYFKRILRTELKSSLIYKLLLISPFGYMYTIKHKRIEKANHYKQKGKKIITSESGYF